jgi:hypothetical protein
MKHTWIIPPWDMSGQKRISTIWTLITRVERTNTMEWIIKKCQIRRMLIVQKDSCNATKATAKDWKTVSHRSCFKWATEISKQKRFHLQKSRSILTGKSKWKKTNRRCETFFKALGRRRKSPNCAKSNHKEPSCTQTLSRTIPKSLNQCYPTKDRPITIRNQNKEDHTTADNRTHSIKMNLCMSILSMDLTRRAISISNRFKIKTFTRHHWRKLIRTRSSGNKCPSRLQAWWLTKLSLFKPANSKNLSMTLISGPIKSTQWPRSKKSCRIISKKCKNKVAFQRKVKKIPFPSNQASAKSKYMLPQTLNMKPK